MEAFHEAHRLYCLFIGNLNSVIIIILTNWSLQLAVHIICDFFPVVPWFSVLDVYLCLPLVQGILVTTHFLLSVCGVQVWEVTKAGVVSGMWTCGRGERTRDCEPFLNPHVLFFFVQEPHWLHSPSSHSEARWPAGKLVSERFTAPTSHICFAACLPAFYSSVVLTQDNEFRLFPNLKAIFFLFFWLEMDRLRGFLWTWNVREHMAIKYPVLQDNS